MEKGKIILTLFSVMLFLAVICASATAQDRIPGVTPGNTFTYGNLSFEWYCNDTSVTPPQEWEEINQTEWFSATVENVISTNVTCNLLVHYKNGTEITEDGWVDVDTGDNLNMEGLFVFISANLSASNSIYRTGNFSTWIINETIPWPYPGGSRETNHINLTHEESSLPPYYYYVYWSQNYYWDKATGALTEVSVYVNQTLTTYTAEYSISIKLTESNVWVIPEFVGLPQILLLLASLTLVALANRRKLRKTQNR